MLGHDPPLELPVLLRVADVQGRAENGDGPAAGRQHAVVRGGVDAFGKAADDDDALPCQLDCQLARAAQARGRGLPGADDGDPRAPQDELDVPRREQQFRRVLPLELTLGAQKLWHRESSEGRGHLRYVTACAWVGQAAGSGSFPREGSLPAASLWARRLNSQGGSLGTPRPKGRSGEGPSRTDPLPLSPPSRGRAVGALFL